MINITPTQLRKAADIQEKIQSLQGELNEILGGEVPARAQATEAPKKYKFSAASRAKMRAAQKARWAKIKGTAPQPEPAPKKKRKFSAQALANIRAGVAKRMAAQEGKPVKRAKWKLSAEGLANIRAGVAKRMAAQGKAPAAKPTRKRTMSPAAKKKMAVLMKARWAKAKKAGKSRL
jgi:hypothetical protein